MDSRALENAMKYMSPSVCDVFNMTDPAILEKINEIRIRKYMPLAVVIRNSTFFPDYNGDYYDYPPPHAVTVGEKEFERLFMTLCDYSLHRHLDTLTRGYITLDGGIRAAAAGSAVYSGGEVSSVKDITSISISIPRAAEGCSLCVLEKIFKGSCPSVIVSGAPGSGKTTFLRDLARQLSGGFDKRYRKVCVVDERNEICPKYGSKFVPEIGENTDVLSSFPKGSGIEIAVRTLSPDVIVCDEIGNDAEARSIESGLACGAAFAVSVHAPGRAELKRKSIIKTLLKTGEFSYIILLNRRTYAPEIIDAREVEDEISRSGAFYSFRGGNVASLFRPAQGKGADLQGTD